MSKERKYYDQVVGDFIEKVFVRIRAREVEVLDNYKLQILFTTGETKIFNVEPLLTQNQFAPLTNKDLFATASIKYGTVVWQDGDIEIDSEDLYDEGVAVE